MIVQLFDNVPANLKATDRMASDDEFHGWKVPVDLIAAADYADHCEIKEG